MLIISEITEQSLKEIIIYFDEEKLFYKTKRPGTLKTFEIKEILSDSQVIYENGKVIGIISYEISKLHSKTISINLSILADIDYKRNAEEILEYLINVAYSKQCKYLLVTIFSFDEPTKQILNAMRFEKNATIYGSVYKDGKYHNKEIYIYCLGDK